MVDDEYFEYLNQWKWNVYKRHGNFYAKRHIEKETGVKTTIDMHIMVTGKGPVGMIRDHIDGNGLNNQRRNLRFVTNRQNLQNRHTAKTSKYPGVSFDKSAKKWKAQIHTGDKYKNLGRYQSEAAAFDSYCRALDRMGERLIGVTG